MRISYWYKLGSTMFRKTLKIEDGMDDTVDIEIDEEDNVKRKFLIGKSKISFKLIKQRSAIDPEEVLKECHFTHEDFERIIENDGV